MKSLYMYMFVLVCMCIWIRQWYTEKIWEVYIDSTLPLLVLKEPRHLSTQHPEAIASNFLQFTDSVCSSWCACVFQIYSKPNCGRKTAVIPHILVIVSPTTLKHKLLIHPTQPLPHISYPATTTSKWQIGPPALGAHVTFICKMPGIVSILEES